MLENIGPWMDLASLAEPRVNHCWAEDGRGYCWVTLRSLAKVKECDLRQRIIQQLLWSYSALTSAVDGARFTRRETLIGCSKVKNVGVAVCCRVCDLRYI